MIESLIGPLELYYILLDNKAVVTCPQGAMRTYLIISLLHGNITTEFEFEPRRLIK